MRRKYGLKGRVRKGPIPKTQDFETLKKHPTYSDFINIYQTCELENFDFV